MQSRKGRNPREQWHQRRRGKGLKGKEDERGDGEKDRDGGCHRAGLEFSPAAYSHTGLCSLLFFSSITLGLPLLTVCLGSIVSHVVLIVVLLGGTAFFKRASQWQTEYVFCGRFAAYVLKPDPRAVVWHREVVVPEVAPEGGAHRPAPFPWTSQNARLS